MTTCGRLSLRVHANIAERKAIKLEHVKKKVLLPYMDFSIKLNVFNGVLSKGDRIVVPISPSRDVKLDKGHMSMQKC